MQSCAAAGRQRPAGTLLFACAALACSAAVLAQPSEGLKLRGNVAAEYLRLPSFEGEAGGVRYANPLQERNNAALKLQLEASQRLDENWSAAGRAFLREDGHNHDRDAARLDEAWLQYATPGWDLRVGNQLVTWGSVESVSPLDVINPRDYEEDLVEPAKVGLAMARMRWRLPASDLSLYWLPGFKPSTFAGPHSYYAIGGGTPNVYPQERWNAHQWAVRYFGSANDLDIGLSFLRGLERNARFEFDPTSQSLHGSTYFSNRLGTDLTYVAGDLVLKLEAVYRTTQQEGNRKALLYALGTEYTLSSVWRHADLTLFTEYLASSNNVRDIELMQNDVFAALRWTLNDELKQRLQIGTFLDLDTSDAYVWRIEHQLSPSENVDIGARYTVTRNYYPGPRHLERDTGVFHLFARYNF